jgi:hypothetical protein
LLQTSLALNDKNRLVSFIPKPRLVPLKKHNISLLIIAHIEGIWVFLTFTALLLFALIFIIGCFQLGSLCTP